MMAQPPFNTVVGVLHIKSICDSLKPKQMRGDIQPALQQQTKQTREKQMMENHQGYTPDASSCILFTVTDSLHSHKGTATVVDNISITLLSQTAYMSELLEDWTVATN